MITLASIVAVLFFLVLLALVANVGQIVNRKIETQNAADAVAYTGAVWMARGMNSLAATNHLIGELAALVVIHDSFGGTSLDDDQPFDSGEVQPLNTGLKIASQAADDIGPVPTIGRHTVTDEDEGGEIHADAMLIQAKVRLKEIQAAAYAVHLLGNILIDTGFPPAVAAGGVLVGAAVLFELKVTQEYLTLNVMQKIARGLVTLKQQLRDTVDPALFLYTVATVAKIPTQASQAARQVAEANGVEGALYQDVPKLLLPVMNDQADDDNRSQLAQATYPWVICWRQPLLDLMRELLTLSGAADFYQQETFKRTGVISGQIRAHGVKLFVMLDTTPSNKGSELWAHGLSSTLLADPMFTLVGAVRHQPPRMTAPPLYHQANPDGLIAYAQAMFYNAGPQQPLAGEQLNACWDTLNWDPRTGPIHVYDGNNSPGPRDGHAISIRLNWQAKLTPVTRMPEAADALAGQIGSTLRRVAPVEGDFRTH